MENRDPEYISELHVGEIQQACRHAADLHGLQAADAEACEIGFELQMRDPKRLAEWKSKGFSLAWANVCAANYVQNYRRHLDLVRDKERGDDAAQAKAAFHASEEPGPERQAQIYDVKDQLEVATGALPDPMGMMIWMHFKERRTYAEIAAVLGTTPEAVRKSVNRGLKVVRSHLELAGFDPDEAMRILESPPGRS